MQIKYASPFPSKIVRQFIENAKLSINIEENRLSVALDNGSFGKRGQMELHIRSMTGLNVDKRLLKENARPFSVEEIYSCVKKLESDKNLDTIFGERI